jgi:endonuclease YncB( thermonuclease family)
MTWLGKTFLLCCVVSGAAVSAASIQGLVVGVSDCDTITVLDENRHQHKIRLAGIDAPEKGQDFSQRSKQASAISPTGSRLRLRRARRTARALGGQGHCERQ